MTTNKRESLLIASGVFILTAGSIEALRWFGYLQAATPIIRTAFSALAAAVAFCLTYCLRAAHSGDKTGK